MNAYGEAEVELHAFLTSALDRGEWSAYAPATLIFGRDPLVPTGQEAG